MLRDTAGPHMLSTMSGDRLDLPTEYVASI
jgi:hypothetical protein